MPLMLLVIGVSAVTPASVNAFVSSWISMPCRALQRIDDILERRVDEIHFGRLVESLDNLGFGGAGFLQVDAAILFPGLGQLSPHVGRRIDDRLIVGEGNGRLIDQVQRRQILLLIVCRLIVFNAS